MHPPRAVTPKAIQRSQLSIVSFTTVTNVASIRVMERIGLRRDSCFDHPRVPEGHPLRPARPPPGRPINVSADCLPELRLNVGGLRRQGSSTSTKGDADDRSDLGSEQPVAVRTAYCASRRRTVPRQRRRGTRCSRSARQRRWSATVASFAFDGGAATYFGTGLLALLITVLTLGICYPFALVLRERWNAKHSYIDGHRLQFRGSAWGLFGNWLKWFALCIITVGIYSFWVGPRIARWKWENTGFEAPVHAVRQLTS